MLLIFDSNGSLPKTLTAASTIIKVIIPQKMVSNMSLTSSPLTFECQVTLPETSHGKVELDGIKPSLWVNIYDRSPVSVIQVERSYALYHFVSYLNHRKLALLSFSVF